MPANGLPPQFPPPPQGAVFFGTGSTLLLHEQATKSGLCLAKPDFFRSLASRAAADRLGTRFAIL